MAWYDDASLYYGAAAEVLTQGDIVVAATGVFEGDRGDVSPASPLYFGEERLVQVWLGSTGTLPEAPSLGLRARWGLAMVLPHACALEKEFNERVATTARNSSSMRPISRCRHRALPPGAHARPAARGHVATTRLVLVRAEARRN